MKNLNLNWVKILIATLSLAACRSSQKDIKEEQISVPQIQSQKSADSILQAKKLDSLANTLVPTSVIITGLPNYRLVSIYKPVVNKQNKTVTFDYSRSYEGNSEYWGETHFMPGIDILYGYNLVNIGHYDIKNEKTTTLFDKPVLIKTLYYPSAYPDSIDKKPVQRNYFLVSVYDEDTNHDSVLNKKDLRHFYYIDESNSQKIALIPQDYSVVRSQYDANNDFMYIYTRKDDNKNGTIEGNDARKIFWISLKAPAEAKVLY